MTRADAHSSSAPPPAPWILSLEPWQRSQTFPAKPKIFVPSKPTEAGEILPNDHSRGTGERSPAQRQVFKQTPAGLCCGRARPRERGAGARSPHHGPGPARTSPPVPAPPFSMECLPRPSSSSGGYVCALAFPLRPHSLLDFSALLF